MGCRGTLRDVEGIRMGHEVVQRCMGVWGMSGYHADTPITIKAEAIP